MKGKNHSDGQRKNPALCAFQENQVDQTGGQGVPGNIHEQITPGMRAEQLSINKVGDPSEGMPVADICICESPDQVIPGNTTIYMIV